MNRKLATLDNQKQLTTTERRVTRIALFLEDVLKKPMFGCQQCGECILSHTAFICCQRCPKRLRNGPCGGTGEGGRCEVYPERYCVWYRIDKRSRLLNRKEFLYPIEQIHNWNLEKTSAWLNVFKKRIKPPALFLTRKRREELHHEFTRED